MTTRTIALTDALHAYLLDVSLREPPALARLRVETAALPDFGMQIAPEQGQFMALLLRLMDARQVLEIGTFTGYSALAMALAMGENGRVVACDVSEEWTAIARRHWREAGVADRIELRLAPALQTLDALIDGGAAGRFDFAFIDADKKHYPDYYERCMVLVRPGGLIAIDNALWGGRVLDPDPDPATAAIRALNAAVGRDERVDASLAPIGDGLLLARKRTSEGD